jgi:hypothetical protein
MVKGAIGLLSASGLPDHIVNGFLNCVDNLEGEEKTNARKACNLLIYWASCRYYDRSEVFKCSRIIRALGYTALADKLEIDRTAARISEQGNELIALVIKRKSGFIQELRRIPGAKETGVCIGNKAEWKMPLSSKNYFLTLLGVYYGGDLACGDSSIWTIPRKSYYELKGFRNPVPAAVPAIPVAPKDPVVTIQTDYVTGIIRVQTPFDAGYVEALKKAVPYTHRRWTGDRWEFKLQYDKVIRGLIQTHFRMTA